MLSRISKFRALSWPERRVLLAAMLLSPLFWIGLRVFGLSRFHAWLNCRPIAAETSGPGLDLATVSTLVNIAGNHAPGRSTCLTRSLLLRWLLSRRGVRSELRIGVRLDQGNFEAHAWVEHEGRPINEAQDVAERFAIFDGPLSLDSFSWGASRSGCGSGNRTLGT